MTGLDIGPNLVEAARRLADINEVDADCECADSPAFDFIQNLVPAGKRGDSQYRPSWLRRREWARYVAAEDQRHLTTEELRRGGGAPWRSVQLTPYGLTSRLERLLPDRLRSALWSFDEVALRRIPPLRRFCRTVLAQYAK